MEIEPPVREIASSYRANIIVRRWAATYIDLACVVLPVPVAAAILGPETFTLGLVIGIMHAIAFVYHAAFEGVYGISLGKWLFGIRVVDVEGNSPGLNRAAIRTALRLVEVNPLLFGGVPAGLVADFTRYRQRLGDLLAKTYVVKYSDLKRIHPQARPARIRGPHSDFLEWGMR